MKRIAIEILVSCLALGFQASGQSVITTVAGTDWVPGNGTVALNAALAGVCTVAVGSQGNLYVAVPGQVFVVGADGSIRSVAGNGTAGFSGDGGLATAAELGGAGGAVASSPGGLALDSSGNLFIADTSNNRIRKVSPDGIITTVAGTGNRNVSADGGLATATDLYYPTGIAVDSSGNLFIVDNGRIRKVSASGIITTVAGHGGVFAFNGDGGPATAADLSAPNSVAVDGSGNLFIADMTDNRIRKVSVNGIITTVAGGGAVLGDGGPATAAQLDYPMSVVVDGSGNLFIADTLHNRIRKVSASGIITTVAGNGAAGFSGDGGQATSATFNSPSSVAVDSSGNLFIADTTNERVRKVSASGIVTTVAGTPNNHFSGDGGPATAAWLWSPNGVAVDSSGNIFFADTNNRRIRKVTPGGIVTTIAGNGELGFSGDGGPATQAPLGTPSAVAVDSSGNVFISDADNLRIRKVSANGIITTVAGNGIAGFSGDGGPATQAQLQRAAAFWNFFGGIAVDRSGNLFIADTGNQRVRKVSPDGIIATVAGNGVTTGEQIFTVGTFAGDGGPATAASLSLPTGVAVDASGNLFIADDFNYRIRKVSSSGIITTVAGNGTTGFSGDGGPATSASLAGTDVGPYGVAVDASGNLFIADTGNSRIRKVFANGIITTVAGGGKSIGDGGPPTSAGLSGPKGVAVDGSGNLFIADTGNGRIRKVSQPPPAPTITPGGVSPVYSSVTTIQPGEWVSIYGQNLASSTATWAGDFPKSLGGTSVTIDGKAASLSFVSPGQINLQAPDDTATGAVPVVVTTAGGTATATVTLAPIAPSFLLLDGKHVAGIILRSNGSGAYGGGSYDIIGPTGNSLGYPTVAAKAGDSILVFAVGLGPTNPAVPAGQAFSAAAPTTNPVNVLIDNVSVTPGFAGLSGAGLYQLNLTVPAGLGTGEVSLAATVGGSRTPANVVISLAPPAAQ